MPDSPPFLNLKKHTKRRRRLPPHGGERVCKSKSAWRSGQLHRAELTAVNKRQQEKAARELGQRFIRPRHEIPQAWLAEIAGDGIGDSANPERYWLRETTVARKEQLQAAQESE
jgi:hypothetical protein